jgi:hypothetical protein
MANIFRVYKDSQVTTDRIRAEAAADSIVTPERVVYVFGTADDVAPNFTTVSGAITYANSLTPIVTEPVVIRLFTKADGTPYTLAGLSSWTTYANSYIYFASDFVRLNETTTLPTTLPAGLQVWYIDPNGVETLWVGREDGSAWPAVGYKEYVATLTQEGTNAPVASVLSSTIGTAITYERVSFGQYRFTFPSGAVLMPFGIGVVSDLGGDISISQSISGNFVNLDSLESGSPTDGYIDGWIVNLRIYP